MAFVVALQESQCDSNSPSPARRVKPVILKDDVEPSQSSSLGTSRSSDPTKKSYSFIAEAKRAANHMQPNWTSASSSLKRPEAVS